MATSPCLPHPSQSTVALSPPGHCHGQAAPTAQTQVSCPGHLSATGPPCPLFLILIPYPSSPAALHWAIHHGTNLPELYPAWDRIVAWDNSTTAGVGRVKGHSAHDWVVDCSLQQVRSCCVLWPGGGLLFWLAFLHRLGPEFCY